MKFSEALTCIILTPYRSRPVVVHDFGEYTRCGDSVHHTTVCGLDVGKSPWWVPVGIISDTRTRPCQRCWVPE